jgi:nucleoside-diphosphate-sugar epimerase
MSEFLDPTKLPAAFADVQALDEFMTRPTQALADDLAALDGDIMVLGVGGKMGPSLARLAKRAAPDKTVIGVARFSEAGLQDELQGHGIETIICDLLDADKVAGLPKAKNIIFMAGRKFGSSGAEELTWAMNVHVPAIVAQAFRDSRIVSFSTGNIYPFTPLASMGATEDTPLESQSGEYGNSCIGRERMFHYFSGQFGTPVAHIRLNYAIDMRYGVLFDVASKVIADQPVDVTMGHANVIWQGDANAQALRALRHCASPPLAINVTGPEVLSIRAVAHEFAARFSKQAVITGQEAEDALLSNSSRASALFGYPTVPIGHLIDWTADWIARDMPTIDKPTHFEVRDGSY